MAESTTTDFVPRKQTGAPRWAWIASGLVLIVFVAIVLKIIFIPSASVWTDDAYVKVHYVTIAPRISGQVAAVAVDDNQLVKAGQLLAALDDADYRTAADNAAAVVQRDQALMDSAAAAVARQPALISEAEAAVAAAQARLEFAQADARRYDSLARTGFGTVQHQQQADSTLRGDSAALSAAKAALEASRVELVELTAQKTSAAATVVSDKASLKQALLNLSYTRIVAPMDGVIGERGAQVGDYVGPGTALMSLVPLEQTYIIANYREVALRHVRPGQAVKIHVDAYDINLNGVVDGIAPASGTVFSPIPPDNATGNFTKIVQRLPVKILVTPNQPLARLLRVGLSVETTIQTDFAPVVDDAAAQRTTTSADSQSSS